MKTEFKSLKGYWKCVSGDSEYKDFQDVSEQELEILAEAGWQVVSATYHTIDRDSHLIGVLLTRKVTTPSDLKSLGF